MKDANSNCFPKSNAEFVNCWFKTSKCTKTKLLIFSIDNFLTAKVPIRTGQVATS